jgi:hypothetical protein
MREDSHLSKRGSHMCHVYIMIHVRGISLAIFRMRLCLQALATLSQAQIHNLVAFLLSKTVSPIPFPPLEINESPAFATGLNGHVPEEHWNPYCVMVQCLPARSGKLERLLCTCRSNSPDIASPRTLLEPVYCETRSVHCPGKMTIGTNTVRTLP